MTSTSQELRPRSPTRRPPDDDEIDLFELALTLWRGKLWIVGGGLLAGLLAFGWLLMTPAVYESRAVIQIGEVDGVLEAPQHLVHRLREEVGLDNPVSRPLPRLEAVEWDRRAGGDVITLRARAGSPDAAQQQLQTVVDALLESHRTIYQNMLASKTQRRDALLAERQALREHRDAIETIIDTAREVSPQQASFLIMESRAVGGRINSMSNQIDALQAALVGSRTQPTHVLREPTSPRSAVEPRVRLTLLLAGLLGLFAGTGVLLLRQAIINRQQARTLSHAD